MSEMVARCRSCGFEQSEVFPSCPVCAGEYGWWCTACAEWRPGRSCPLCGGLLLVPEEVHLGAFPPGVPARIHFTVRNPGRKVVEFALQGSDPAVAVSTRRFALKPGEGCTILGAVTVTSGPPGRRFFRIRFTSPIPAETRLILEVVPAVIRLEFSTPEVVFKNAAPGTAVRRKVLLKNTGNVPVTAVFSALAPWLAATPAKLELAPMASATVTVSARSRKGDSGAKLGQLRVAVGTEYALELPVRLQLPEPQLTAAAVDLGEVRPGRPAYQTIQIRNTGKVRVACELATERPWLAVVPKRLNLPPGKDKLVKLRAVLPVELVGPQSAALLGSCDEREVLRVPVSVLCRVPQPVLAPIRRQTLGAIARDLPVIRRFRLGNTGDGRLECTITADVPWIEVLTPELGVSPGKRRRVEFRIATPSMPRGMNVATLRVRSNGGNADVPVSLSVVNPEPELEVLGDLDLGTLGLDGAASGMISVRNVGVGLLNLRAEPIDSRLAVNPTELTLPPGPPSKLVVSVATAGLDSGQHISGVRFSSNGGTGYAEVRFRLPIEELEAPTLIELGDRPAGRPTGDALRVRNTGPDRLTLLLRPQDPWVRPGTERVVLKPGEMLVIPFRVDLRPGMLGQVSSMIWLEGRTVRHGVAVQVMARRVELAVIPQTLLLGDMESGEERNIRFQISNNGELPVEVRETHAPGELEVWVRRKVIQPGTTETLVGRVKLHSREVGKEVRALVQLTGETALRLEADVASSSTPRQVAIATAGGGLVVGGVVGATVGWGLGAIIAIACFLLGAAILALFDGA